MKDSPKRAEAARRAIEQAGGKMWVWYTLGEYDFVAISEAPNDEVILRILLVLGSQGNIRTKTLKAWPEADAAKVMGQLP